MKTFKQFFLEQQQKWVILLPGGYKPPTKGHKYLIESYNNNPSVDAVIVLIGPEERDGITREQSRKIFDLYGISNLDKVIIEDTKFPSPMTAAFDFVEKDDRALKYKGKYFGLGASNKPDDKGVPDSKRCEIFNNYFTKNPSKLREGLHVGVPPIIDTLSNDNNVAVSATKLRQAIQNSDTAQIKQYIPDDVSAEEFLKVIKGV